MKVSAFIAAMLGLALAVALIAWQGFDSVAAALASAGWGLLVVTAYYLFPMWLDSAGWRPLFPIDDRPTTARLLHIRWIRDGINRLLPVAQVGGDLASVRLLMRDGVPGATAGASIVLDVTLALVSQLLFTLLGVMVLLMIADAGAVLYASLAVLGLGALVVMAFIVVQLKGMFEVFVRWISDLSGGGDKWIASVGGAARLDAAIRELYTRGPDLVVSTAWRLLAWIAGVGEVWLALYFLGYPVTLLEALMLESLGQAIKNLAFTIPGALGVQEGGFMLLVTLLGIPPEVGLSLSLVKRVRQLLLGIPAVIAFQISEGRHFLRSEA
ncbi:MAG: lysylphosphatidylglycerol synthase domain-containing protein [Pseudomonadota bacterium]|nr:lysylphosphatidylglycerol synthase domain-containing protein [Pseudomonadota bacterium]